MRRRRGETSLAGAFLDLRADYDAARDNRFRKRLSGYSAMGSGADYHIRNWTDNLRMMELARSFDRNDMVVGQAITRVIRNCLQDGIRPDPQTGDDGLNAEQTARWKAWATDPDQCDKAGEHDFNTLAALALRSAIVDGDVLVLPLRDKTGSLQMIEAHRLRTPTNTRRNVVHGVLVDDYRKRLEYWVTKDNIPPHQNVQRVSEIESYPARDEEGNRAVFHVYNPKRFSQTRGITHLAPVANPVGMHDDLQFANLVKAQVASCFAIIQERDMASEGGALPPRGEVSTETLTDGTTRTIEGTAPGMHIVGAPGDKYHGFAPNIPNPEFFPHAKLILTFIAINLDLPVAVLLLDPSETNFSGWRGAMDQARLGFRDIQQWIIRQLFRPTYLWKTRQWLSEDATLRVMDKRSDIDVFGHEWRPPSWAYIEPSKDAKADETRLKNHLISPRRVHAERGRDWDNVAVEIVEDRAKLVRKAIEIAGEINTKFPDAGVEWRELAGFANKGPGQGDEKDDEGKDDESDDNKRPAS